MRRSTRGFTLLELVVALAVVAILLAVAVPSYVAFVRQTRALQAIGDLYAIRAAAYLVYGDTSRWPPDYPAGVAPPTLIGRLPAGFRFVRPHYRLKWENWTMRRWGRSEFRQNIAVGVSVVSSDPKLLEAIEILLARQHVARTAVNKSTLQVAGENGI